MPRGDTSQLRQTHLHNSCGGFTNAYSLESNQIGVGWTFVRYSHWSGSGDGPIVSATFRVPLRRTVRTPYHAFKRIEPGGMLPGD